MNKWFGQGNITKDPELRYTTTNNIAVCSFTLAINEYDTTEFIKVECWKKLAENVNKYCKKGSKVLVEGKLATEEYTNKDNVKVKSWKIKAFGVEFLDTKHEIVKEELPDGDIKNIEEELPF